MKITIRKGCRDGYRDVTFTYDSTRIEMGLLDIAERVALARALEEAVDDLLSGIEATE